MGCNLVIRARPHKIKHEEGTPLKGKKVPPTSSYSDSSKINALTDAQKVERLAEALVSLVQARSGKVNLKELDQVVKKADLRPEQLEQVIKQVEKVGKSLTPEESYKIRTTLGLGQHGISVEQYLEAVKQQDGKNASS